MESSRSDKVSNLLFVVDGLLSTYLLKKIQLFHHGFRVSGVKI
jgi:hypothetical protein